MLACDRIKLLTADQLWCNINNCVITIVSYFNKVDRHSRIAKLFLTTLLKYKKTKTLGNVKPELSRFFVFLHPKPDPKSPARLPALVGTHMIDFSGLSIGHIFLSHPFSFYSSSCLSHPILSHGIPIKIQFN